MLSEVRSALYMTTLSAMLIQPDNPQVLRAPDRAGKNVQSDGDNLLEKTANHPECDAAG